MDPNGYVTIARQNTFKREPRLLLAVLVDADNVPAKYFHAIMREICEIGEPALRRVYGDWSNPALSQWKEKTRSLGLVARQATATSIRKNSTDIALVIDAMDILHTGRFDGFVIVSSDSDFTQLACRLREDGRLVIGIGELRTPVALKNVCNRFILIENLAPAGTLPVVNKKAKEATPIIRAAMESLLKNFEHYDNEWILLAPVGTQVRLLHADFDPRTYGATKLLELVCMLPEFEVRKGSNGHPSIRFR